MWRSDHKLMRVQQLSEPVKKQQLAEPVKKQPPTGQTCSESPGRMPRKLCTLQTSTASKLHTSSLPSRDLMWGARAI